MYSLIVGGFLPGTNIQVSFQVWTAFITLLFGSSSIVWIEYKHHLLQTNNKQVLAATKLHYLAHPRAIAIGHTASALRLKIADWGLKQF